MTDSIDSCFAEWSAAERSGDVAKLDELLTDDFVGIGPLGFSLPKPAWIARHQQGLRYDTFETGDLQVRTYGEVAVMTGRLLQHGTFGGYPVPAVMQATHVLVGDDQRWRLGAVHLSFVAGTPGSPPIPGVPPPTVNQAGTDVSNPPTATGHQMGGTMPTTIRPAGRRAQAAAFRLINVPVRALLGLPVPTVLGKRLMLVHHTGRRTGRHYRQPVSYVQAEGTLLTPGGGRWTRNLAGGDPVHIRLCGRDVAARPELVADHDEVERLLAVMAKANPSLKRFVRIPADAKGHLDRKALAAAIEHGFRVVRWHLEPYQEPDSHEQERRSARC